MNRFIRIVCMSLFIVILTGCVNGTQNHQKERDGFKDNFDAFNRINTLVLDFVSANDISVESNGIYFGVEYADDGDITGLYQYTDDLAADEIVALSKINELLHNDFDYIRYYEDRISYGGDGGFMYVYMEYDKVPSFFFSQDDGLNFSIYKICDNWYLLYHYFGR